MSSARNINQSQMRTSPNPYERSQVSEREICFWLRGSVLPLAPPAAFAYFLLGDSARPLWTAQFPSRYLPARCSLRALPLIVIRSCSTVSAIPNWTFSDSVLATASKRSAWVITLSHVAATPSTQTLITTSRWLAEIHQPRPSSFDTSRQVSELQSSPALALHMALLSMLPRITFTGSSKYVICPQHQPKPNENVA